MDLAIIIELTKSIFKHFDTKKEDQTYIKRNDEK
jgi:hypothetical protein